MKQSIDIMDALVEIGEQCPSVDRAVKYLQETYKIEDTPGLREKIKEELRRYGLDLIR